LRDNTTAAEAAQRKFNDSLEKAKEYADGERARVTELVNAIKDETKTRRERQLKLGELQRMYPDIFSNLDLETAKNLDLAAAIRSVNEELDRKSTAENEDRVIAITKELVKLREDHGKFVFAGTESYQINNLRKIKELEAERALLIKKAREERGAEIDSMIELADWQKTVDRFTKENNASFLKYSNQDGTVYSYITRMRDDYDDLTKKYEAYSGLVDEGSKKQAAIYKENIRLTKQLASEMGFSLDPKDDAKRNKGWIGDQNAIAKATERLSELRAKMALEEKKYALEIEQVRVDARKDGTEKELAQIELTKKKDLLAIEERKQAMINTNLDIARAKWESEGKSGVFSEEIKLTEFQLSVLESMITAADIKEKRAKELMMENLLEQYRDYAKKIEDIEKKKNKKIKDLNDGRTASNSELVDRAIAEAERIAKEETATLAFDEMKNSNAWRVLFSDLENYTIETLKSSLEEVQKTDTSKLNAADAKAVQQAIDRLKQKIDEKNPFFALRDGWESFVKATDENQPDAAMEALNRFSRGVQEVIGYFEELKGLMSAATGGNSDASFWTNIAGDIMSSNVSTGMGAAKLLMGDPSGIKDVIKGITGYINVFKNIRNRRYDKEIEKQEKVVRSLEKEYRRLGEAMEESLGSDYYKAATQQAENLKKQVSAINKQIEAEKKKGKDSDKKKIEELEAQRQEKMLESERVVKDAIDRLTGSDIVSAAEDFAQAWLDAYVSFGSTTEAMEKRFGDMMQNMVINSALSNIMKKSLEPVFALIDKFWQNDNAMSPQEIAQISALSADIIKSGDAIATEYMKNLEQLGINLRNKETNLTGISKGVSNITEDMALVLGGYLNSIRQRFFEYTDFMMLPENRPTMAVLIQYQTAMINHLQAIELNTAAIATSSNAILKRFEDVVISSSTGKGWALNVNA